MEAGDPGESIGARAGHAQDLSGPMFRPVINDRTGELDRPFHPDSVYSNIVVKYALQTGVSAAVKGLYVHALRANRRRMPYRRTARSPRSRNGSTTRS
jgi:hypothetical protein